MKEGMLAQSSEVMYRSIDFRFQTHNVGSCLWPARNCSIHKMETSMKLHVERLTQAPTCTSKAETDEHCREDKMVQGVSVSVKTLDAFSIHSCCHRCLVLP